MTVEQLERCAVEMGACVAWQGDALGARAGRTLMLRRTSSVAGTLARGVHELAEWAAGEAGGSVAHACGDRIERHYRAVLAHLPGGLTAGPGAEEAAPAVVVRCEAPERFEDG